jgi:tRNA-intron endonuclease, archaea type
VIISTLQPEGYLVENRIVVWNIDSSRRLYSRGYFGKPMGIPKPKGIEFESPLVLDLIESYYLMQHNELVVRAGLRQMVSTRRIKAICRKVYSDFDRKYIVFQDLRDRGYVVSPGIKFGCDFAVYERGPGIDHAPYLIEVYKRKDLVTATGIVLAGRLATTVKKQFILAVPNLNKKNVVYVGFEWWRA